MDIVKPRRQIISHIPHSGMTPTDWAMVVERELIICWTENMSESEYERLRAIWPCPMDKIPADLLVSLDSEIIYQAESTGWRMELAELVRFRKSQWDHQESGPDLHEKYGLACGKFARVVQGKERPPIDDSDNWVAKKETVDELRSLLGILRPTFAVMKTKPTRDAVLERFSNTVSGSPETYPHLHVNLARWLKFLEQNRDVCRPILLGDKTAPGTLYNEWLAWSPLEGPGIVRWETETLRQRVSQLGKPLRTKGTR